MMSSQYRARRSEYRNKTKISRCVCSYLAHVVAEKQEIRHAQACIITTIKHTTSL